MMSFFKRIIVLSLLVFALASANAETRKLVLLDTSDIHCELVGSGEKSGGWLKLASLIEKERVAAGPEKTLLIDCGDTLQGSLAGSLSRGEAASLLLKELRYDAWIPGNHDFEFGFESFLKCRKLFPGDCLAANIKTPAIEAVAKPWRIYERNGLKIAIIGMSSPHMDAWQWAGLSEKIEVSDMRTALRRIMPEVLAAKPQLIVLAAHEGLFMPARLDDGASLEKIASEFPQISIVLGAHTHALEPGKEIGKGSWYAQPGCHGQHLLRIEIELDTSFRQTPKINSRLIPVDSGTPEHAACRELVQKWLKEVDAQETLILGKSASPLHPRKVKDYQSELDELACRAIAEKSGAQIVVYGTPASEEPLPREISAAALFRTISYDNFIGTLELNETELRRVIAEQFAAHDKGSYQTLWGVYAKVSPEGEISSPLKLPAAKDWPAGTRLKVAFSSHALAGGGGRFPVLAALTKNPENRPEDTRLLVRDAVRDYISAHSPLEIKVSEWLVRSKEKH